MTDDRVETSSAGSGGWATCVITERVKPDHIEGFEKWTRRANANLATAAGFLGIDTIRLDDDGPRYVTMIHFDSQDELDAWQTSDRHQDLLAELEPMIDNKTMQRAEGLEILYAVPPPNRARHPRYWRQVAIVTPVVFLLIVGVNWLLSPIDDLPSLAFLAISVTIVSMLLTWPVMPTITKLAAGFLYPKS